MHTETNFAQGPNGDEAVQWLWKQWANVLKSIKKCGASQLLKQLKRNR